MRETLRFKIRTMFSQRWFWIGVTAILFQTGHVTSHASLIQPAQRSSAWRFGYNNPPNYNDYQLFCGGYSVQWEQNNGSCGVCGDPFHAKIKPNEDVDGTYVINGVITGSYVKGGVINAEVQISAYHKGWFEFRLCPLATMTTKVTQECLNHILLKVQGTNTTRIQLEPIKHGLGPGIYTVDLQLPPTVTCDRCVLQLKYNTGNSWGCDSAGCGLGHGPQENFVNCADIRIEDDGTGTVVTESSSGASQSATMAALTSTTIVKSSSSTTSTTEEVTTATPDNVTTESPATTGHGDEFEICSSEMACLAKDLYTAVPGILQWCCDNCAHGHCPTSHCLCIYI